jgi:hypothetical protein
LNDVVQSVSKQWTGKHSSTTIGLMLEAVFPMLSVQSGYEEIKWGNPVS